MKDYPLMSALLKQIQKELKIHSTPEAKAAALKFVPDAEKVYGIRTPVLNELAKKYKEGGFDLVKELWNSGAFEERLLAAKLLKVICKRDPLLSLQSGRDFRGCPPDRSGHHRRGRQQYLGKYGVDNGL